MISWGPMKTRNPRTHQWIRGFEGVEKKGIEPSTSALRTPRSPD